MALRKLKKREVRRLLAEKAETKGGGKERKSGVKPRKKRPVKRGMKGQKAMRRRK